MVETGKCGPIEMAMFVSCPVQKVLVFKSYLTLANVIIHINFGNPVAVKEIARYRGYRYPILQLALSQKILPLTQFQKVFAAIVNNVY